MIPKECKRLAEVDFPIAVVSKHSAREKSIRHGHPSTLHLWWARRPLAACRAMLMALLLPDPGDDNCPDGFKAEARNILIGKHGRPIRWESELKTAEGLRKVLLEFIADFSNWDNAANTDYLAVARALVKAAHPDETPLVVDPFAGGGSIPLEALRLGCEAFASDLNPVACLILKVMLADIPRHGPALAEKLRLVGTEISKHAEKELAEFYPKDPDGATPIAYLWARTVRCESPNCGAEIPLARSFWLGKKASRKRALRYKLVRPEGELPRVEFEVFEPKLDKEVPGGTVARAKATCPYCGGVLPPERVRAQLAEQRGGADVVFDAGDNRIGGARMLAVVTVRPGKQGRHYRLPTDRDYEAVWKAQKRLKALLGEWNHKPSIQPSPIGRGRRKDEGLYPVPDEPIATTELRRISIPLYGCTYWKDTFTARQLTALSSFTRFLSTHPSKAASAAAALSVSRMTNAHTAFSRWHTGRENVEGIFSRQAVGMVWDFCEGNPLSEATGSVAGGITWVAGVVDKWPASRTVAQVVQADAAASSLPDESAAVWFTDPPYYDAVPYAHLADLFYVWLRRAARYQFPEFFADRLTPKNEECVVDRPHKANPAAKSTSFYESKMAKAMGAGRNVLKQDGVGGIVFAHKSTEGWEALLSGILSSGWTVTASWPVTTEMATRNTARDTASLAASIHLVCRPRPEDAPVGDWADVLGELPKRVGDWMERLQGEGIRGADLVFACIGPALEIFSRYSKVETADGREVKLAEYLEKVWEVVGRTALEQVLGTAEAQARNSAAGALEEDARLTALFLWTLQATNGEGRSEKAKGKSEEVEDEEQEEIDEDEEDTAPKGKAKGYSLVFDVVRRFAQPLGIQLPKWEGRVIETKKGVVRLMAVSERAKQLFGKDGADSVADWIAEDPTKPVQLRLFPESEQERAPRIRGRKRGKVMGELPAEAAAQAGATTLDRVHAAMLLQAGGQANALRALIKAELDRGPDFLRLANALSALYPKGSEEKRLLDAMLLAVPR
jgi:putative DNA methylase